VAIPQIILGSGSPARAQILGFFSLPFKQIASDFDEDTVDFEGDPAAYAERLAKEKGSALAKLHPEAVILTADTTVYFDGIIYNKPKDREEAQSFLRILSGNPHAVYTAVALSARGKCYVKSEKTLVFFNELTEEQIGAYLDRIKFTEKAGSYCVKEGGNLVVKKIDGCYYNVMGLPINSCKELLKIVGVDLWKHLKVL